MTGELVASSKVGSDVALWLRPWRTSATGQVADRYRAPSGSSSHNQHSGR
jgi:hypothetical protein